MIKPEQVPEEVVDAFRDAWTQKLNARKAIAAALSVWPGAAVCHYTIGDDEGYEMVLPLPFPLEERT